MHSVWKYSNLLAHSSDDVYVWHIRTPYVKMSIYEGLMCSMKTYCMVSIPGVNVWIVPVKGSCLWHSSVISVSSSISSISIRAQLVRAFCSKDSGFTCVGFFSGQVSSGFCGWGRLPGNRSWPVSTSLYSFIRWIREWKSVYYSCPANNSAIR